MLRSSRRERPMRGIWASVGCGVVAVVAAAPAARAEPPERVTALVDGEGEAALRQGRTEALAGVLRTVLAQEGLHAAVTGDARAELVESCASLLTNGRVRARRGRAVYAA